MLGDLVSHSWDHQTKSWQTWYISAQLPTYIYIYIYMEKQGRTHKRCTLMDPHTWACKSRTTGTNIHSAAVGCCPEDLSRAMNDREEWRERVRDIHATSATWWWWWYIYIYIVNYRINKHTQTHTYIYINTMRIFLIGGWIVWGFLNIARIFSLGILLQIWIICEKEKCLSIWEYVNKNNNSNNLKPNKNVYLDFTVLKEKKNLKW